MLYSIRKRFCLLLLMLLSVISLSAQETIYHWSSDEGTVSQQGGEITQHNSTAVNRINVECSGYYAIAIVGISDYIDSGSKAEKAQYMQITLSDGHVFHEGDTIEITGMRNTTNTGANATLYMQFGNGTVLPDNNLWNNLGQLQEIGVEGGLGAKTRGTGNGNEDFNKLSTFPSTYRFIVPMEAHGSKSLRLSRNICECRLYITNIDVIRKQSDVTGLNLSLKVSAITQKEKYDLTGKRVSSNYRGIIIKDGRKFVNHSD